MMHRAWSSIVEVSYCFSRSYVKLKGHTALKIVEFDPIGRFRTVTPVWMHQWLWNVAHSLKQQRRYALLFFKVIHQISRSHGTKHHQFWPKLGVSGLKAGRSFQTPQICLVIEQIYHAWPLTYELPKWRLDPFKSINPASSSWVVPEGFEIWPRSDCFVAEVMFLVGVAVNLTECR